MSRVTVPSRFILYVHMSTGEQASGVHFPIDPQTNEIQEFVKRKGGEIIGIYIDEGISGTQRERPQLIALFEVARTRSFDILQVHNLSRLSHSVYHALDTLGCHGLGFVLDGSLPNS